MRGLIKRSVSLAGHRTSVALEAEFWEVLDLMAAHRGDGFAALVAEIDRDRDGETPLASALRVAALRDAIGRGQTESGAR